MGLRGISGKMWVWGEYLVRCGPGGRNISGKMESEERIDRLK